MLERTFVHIRGIGLRRERSLWQKGLVHWDDLDADACISPQMLPLFETGTITAVSRAALSRADVAFFADRLPHSELYRILLQYPDDTVFLDIETTGLSSHYHEVTLIGASRGSRYAYSLMGHDDAAIVEMLDGAKAVVTFNGALFDLPFLRRHKPDLSFPGIHVDLRYFLFGVGLSGGQKAVERRLAIGRPSPVADLSGEHAVDLWVDYRGGSPAALKRLIDYNHADVEGMKALLDEGIRRRLELAEFPSSMLDVARFADRVSRLPWEEDEDWKPPPYRGPTYPLIPLSDLESARPAPAINASGRWAGGGRPPIIVGIDLTGAESRPSGVCILRGRMVTTSRVRTDDELVDLVASVGADLVSIDSPLSLPAGRTSVFDDDPGRDQFGILRECERTLKRRGVNVYPSLILSMQRLTLRGCALAARLRGKGVPVIESFPGAAQDILGIPRKRKGLSRLAAGLAAFGIEGTFVDKPISHDELDAITSAIVGAFFLDGRFEALGSPEEEYLIVPDLNAPRGRWTGSRVIGLSGPIAAGKTTLSRRLEEAGYAYTRYSSVVEDELKRLHRPINRSTLRELGEEIHRDRGQRWLGRRLLERVAGERRIVIDGLRFPEDHAFLREQFGPAYQHVHVAADPAIRAHRYHVRNPEDDFNAATGHAVEQGVERLARCADLTLVNEGSIASATDSLYAFAADLEE